MALPVRCVLHYLSCCVGRKVVPLTSSLLSRESLAYGSLDAVYATAWTRRCAFIKVYQRSRMTVGGPSIVSVRNVKPLEACLRQHTAAGFKIGDKDWGKAFWSQCSPAYKWAMRVELKPGTAWPVFDRNIGREWRPLWFAGVATTARQFYRGSDNHASVN